MLANTLKTHKELSNSKSSAFLHLVSLKLLLSMQFDHMQLRSGILAQEVSALGTEDTARSGPFLSKLALQCVVLHHLCVHKAQEAQRM